ncbi:MAG: ATP-binding cassette domain-containing protein [Gemmataceae bacterium]|nr:ATP-binding cassette domain-containing protein [Gemmataceae bacterium]
MNAVIEIRDLTKRFRRRVVVDHLILAVPRGAVFALLGENGAGKTTTMRMLAGLLQPDAGQARILGEDCWKAAVKLRGRVGYVPERPRFYDWMTVGEIGWFTAGFHNPDFLPRYRDWLAKFKLDLRERLRHLSKGQYAKVGLALALAPDPEVLLLDEPTSGLDLLVRREFLSSMVGLAAEGRTVLISSHHVAEVERVASHVAFIDNGRQLLTASAEELRRRVVRFRLRYEEHAPDPAVLGVVLERNGTGKLWHAVVRDPDRAAVEALRAAEGVHDFEESPLALEEVYCALLAGKEGQP